TVDPGDEIGPLFAKHGLPAPRVVMWSNSALTSTMALAHSDLLMLVPAETVDSILGAPLRRIDIVDEIPRISIVMVRRPGLHRTAAGEYFADMLRRASVRFARKKRRSPAA